MKRHGKIQLIHGKTQLTHGKIQLTHGKIKSTHGKIQLNKIRRSAVADYNSQEAMRDAACALARRKMAANEIVLNAVSLNCES